MANVILKIKKEAGRYFVGGGTPPRWNPLPESLKTRDQIIKYFKGGEIKFCTDDGRHCRSYEVYYHYHDDGRPLELMAIQDEGRKLVISLPVNAKQPDIEGWLLNRAKAEGCEGIIVDYREELLSE